MKHSDYKNQPWIAFIFLLVLFQHALCFGISKEEIAAYAGNYIAKSMVTIAPFDLGDGEDRLLFLDYKTGRTGVLSAVSAREFSLGPGLLVDKPVELELKFIQVKDREITGFDLRSGKTTGKFVKAGPSRQESVTFENQETRLAGTLTLPFSSKPPHPAIVLIHGSDAGRRETFGPLPYFFAHHGYAVLAYDKRGDGSSEGDWRKSAFDVLASDAAAAVQFLKTRKEIDPASIGLMGNSEGGWVALQTTSRSKDVAFLILRVTPAMTPAEQDLARVEPILRASGFSDTEIGEAVKLARLKQNFARTGGGWSEYEQAANQFKEKDWYAFAGGPLKQDAWWWKWYRTKMDYDPLPDLQKLAIPVIAYFGEFDLFVQPEVNHARLKEALTRAKNKNYEIVVLPKANHAFLEAKTGTPGEIPSLKRFVPLYFQSMIDWLAHITPKTSSPR